MIPPTSIVTAGSPADVLVHVARALQRLAVADEELIEQKQGSDRVEVSGTAAWLEVEGVAVGTRTRGRRWRITCEVVR